ncbi:MAG: phage tail protein [Verrucomicrobia bacterium]|nr:phage tail protein [Verrucomicrobiota bacterium]
MKQFLPVFFLMAVSHLAVGQSPYASLQVHKQIQYQDRVATAAGGVWSGTEGYFTFALVQGSTVLWNNWEGTASPSDPGTVSLWAGQVLTLPVNQGVFSIRLGEGSDTNEQIPPTVFFDTTSNSVRNGVKLAVWFSPDGGSFTRLSPDVEFTSVPFAMVAGIAEAVKERAVTSAMVAEGTLLAGDLSAPLQADSLIPSGSVMPFAGTVVPAGWVFCDGSSKLRTDPVFSRLFEIVGITYGADDGNHFNLPDMRIEVGTGLSPRSPLRTGRADLPHLMWLAT